MEQIETGRSDLKAQVSFLRPLSTEYESSAPSSKLNHYWHQLKANAFKDIIDGRSVCCF
jgi:hypothetical protein